jgi:hypothetical protein
MSEVPGQSCRALPISLSGGFGRKVEVSHERTFNPLQSDPPALGSDGANLLQGWAALAT